MDRLFVPFERLGAQETGVEGTGIGLALAQRIVTRLAGTSSRKASMGEGSTFTVDLPAFVGTVITRDVSEVHRSLPRRSTGRTILYIEDQEMNTRLVERILEAAAGDPPPRRHRWPRRARSSRAMNGPDLDPARSEPAGSVRRRRSCAGSRAIRLPAYPGHHGQRGCLRRDGSRSCSPSGRTIT